MKERPILFSSEMVRAILEGRKAVTRRVVKLDSLTSGSQSVSIKPIGSPLVDLVEFDIDHEFLIERWPRQERSMGNLGNLGRCDRIACPYGAIGDRLWVRENFRMETLLEDIPASIGTGAIRFEADGVIKGEQVDEFGRLRPSIHMLRHLSRITLEITAVRVERLQDISEADAQAEGVEPLLMTAEDVANSQISDEPPELKELARLMGPGSFSYKFTFQMLWDSINGKTFPWASNPFVWVVSFRRVT